MIVVGDVHLKDEFQAGRKQPYQRAVKRFWDWYCGSEYNNDDEVLTLLGDLTEKSINQGELNQFYLSLFSKRIKNKHIYILQGNHDINKEGSNLSIFKELDSVNVIEDVRDTVFGVSSCLFLPHFYGKKDGKSMKEFYENLDPEISDKKYDFCFAHLMDETREFGGKKGIDLSYLSIEQRVFGHDHNYNLSDGGNYLGSVSPNSYTEANKKKYIFRIDDKTGEGESIEVPLFLKYKEVEYPNPLPEGEEVDVDIIWTVKEALSKDEAIKFYSKEGDFFYRRIEKKKSKEEKEIEDRRKEENLTTTEDYLKLYKKDTGLKETVFDIVSHGIIGG